jgi:hypothetical protein
MHAPSIESFIKHYIMPVAGEGDFDVDLLNAKGELVRTIPISVMDPNKPPPGISARDHHEGSMMEKLMNRTMDKLDQMEAEARKPPPSFVERMKEMAEIRTMLAPPEEDRKGRGSGDSFMQMLMMMKMMEPAQPAVSPELAELRVELRAMKEAALREPLPTPLPLPPPPPPPPDTTAADIVREVVALTQRKEETSLRDILPLLKPEKTLGAAEITAMITSLAPVVMQVFGGKNDDKIQYLKDQIADLKRTPSRGIKEALEDVGAMVKLAGALGGRRDESETFWGFMNNLITQGPDLAESIGGVVDRIRKDEEAEKKLESPAMHPQEPAQQQEDDEDALDFPPGFESIVKKIEEATDDAARVGQTLYAFQVLGKDKRWRRYLLRVISLAKKGEKDEVMEFLVSFLEALHERGMLSEDAAKAAIEAFDKNFDKVVEELTKRT